MRYFLAIGFYRLAAAGRELLSGFALRPVFGMIALAREGI
jgi:hypothetical protein